MRWRRKHGKPDRALDAAAEAMVSREQAEAELAAQKAAAAAEHRDVLAPLRQIRERNHLAEDFVEQLRRGYS